MANLNLYESGPGQILGTNLAFTWRAWTESQKSLWTVVSGLQFKNSGLQRVRSTRTNHSALTLA